MTSLRSWRGGGPGWAWQLVGAAILALALTASIVPALSSLRALASGGRINLAAAAVLVGLVVVVGLIIVVALGLLAARRPRLAAALALALFVAPRVLFLAARDAPLVSDWLSYHRLALGWLEGAPPIADQPMGYPILLGEAYRLAGVTTTTAETLNLLVGLATAVVLGLVVWKLAGAVPSVMAVAILALTPSQLLFTAITGSEIAYCAVLVGIGTLAIALLRRLDDARRSSWLPVAAALGVALGLSTFVRPTSLAIAPFVVVLPLVVQRTRTALAACATVALATTVALLPIVALNAVHLGRISPATTLFTGWQLYVGANVETGGRWNEADWERVNADVPDYVDSLSLLYSRGQFDGAGLRTAAERDEAALALYRERIERDAARFVAMTPGKFALGWGRADDAANWVFTGGTEDTDGLDFRVARAASQAAWSVLLVLATIGQLAVPRRARSLALLATSVLVPITASVVLLETKGRYHEYAVPILAALAAIALSRGIGTVVALARARRADPPMVGAAETLC